MTHPTDLQEEIERLREKYDLPQWAANNVLRELAAWCYRDAIEAVDDAGGDNREYHKDAIARRAKEVT